MAHYKKKKIPIFAGYINLKAINGVIFPYMLKIKLTKNILLIKL